MQQPAFPADEAYRVKTLEKMGQLDTPSEERFDRLSRITKTLFDVPIVLISLVGSGRVWMKSAVGSEYEQIPRPISFCTHTILASDMLVIEDTLLDHRFADNPLVQGEPYVRFYAGQPIRATNGQALGTLCMIDTKPRQLDSKARNLLRDLALLVEKEINYLDLKMLNDRLLRLERQLLESLTQLRQSDQHERARSRTLEQISRGYPLYEVLAGVAFEIEQLGTDFSVCIEVGRGDDQMPTRYWGTRKSRQPQAGVFSCQSVQITGSNGDILGNLTVVKTPSNRQTLDAQRLIEDSAILASIAIERDQSDQMIWKQANYDDLTGLPNRNLLSERLGQELNKARRHDLLLGLMFIDLDHFKQVNDSLGHHKGDVLLSQAGLRLNACMRDSDTVARVGGDEFTLIAVELSRMADIQPIARKVLHELSREFQLEPESVYLSASIGIAFYPNHGEDTDALIKSADRAMYDAKNSGGNQAIICSD